MELRCIKLPVLAGPDMRSLLTPVNSFHMNRVDFLRHYLKECYFTGL